MKVAPPCLAVIISILVCLVPESVEAAKQTSVACSGGKHTTAHEKCCALYELRDDLQENLFKNKCGDAAHEVLRLAFHDAIGYSLSGRYQGKGADGSIMIFNSTELAYPANIGVNTSVAALWPFLGIPQYKNTSAGDLIQFAAAVGLSNCPGAPRLEFFAGREKARAPASDGTIPSPGDSVDDILDRMADAGFSPNELVHLLASHTIAHAGHVDDTLPAPAPLDSTPDRFDSQFFLEVLLRGKGYTGNGSANAFEASSALFQEGEIRLKSDYLLARDNRTACTWQSLIGDQREMMQGFRDAMAKLAVTGQNKSELVDCSDAVPQYSPLPVSAAIPIISASRRKEEEGRYLTPERERERRLLGLSVSVVYPSGTCFADVEKSCPSAFPAFPVSSE